VPGESRCAIAAAEVQHPQRRRYPKRLCNCFSRLSHQGGNLGKVTFLPQRFVWIHGRGSYQHAPEQANPNQPGATIKTADNGSCTTPSGARNLFRRSVTDDRIQILCVVVFLDPAINSALRTDGFNCITSQGRCPTFTAPVQILDAAGEIAVTSTNSRPVLIRNRKVFAERSAMALNQKRASFCAEPDRLARKLLSAMPR